MASSLVSASIRPGTLIAGRYLVEFALGKGGMGSVYAVRDESSQERFALKYLQREAAVEDGPAAALFQREYHTLAHLRHPCIVRVHDYGVDAGRPYYTMELIDGNDLRELAPLDMVRACSALRDVASALALLHSRRLLHRDLSPRNVRSTRAGQAKLLDFGAMAQMGVAKDVAGTPPYMAPEAVHGQALDARTDLYALGALLYWTLTGRDAYPARDARELRPLWQRPLVPPSAVASGIPDALDALVMSLLSLDLEARPSHAAEVIERLTAIAALPRADALDVAAAYLTSPTLVGHGETLWSFRKRLVRAARGRGSSVLISGRPGSGRSRLLQAFVLEAKLCGVLVVRADVESMPRDELAVARAILIDAIDGAPDLALASFEPYAAALGPLVPRSRGRFAFSASSDSAASEERRARVLPALREFLLAISEQRPLLIAIDDLDHADEGSAACISVLAGDARDSRLVIAASAEDAGAGKSLAAFALGATRLQCTPLDAEGNLSLLRSVFGDVAQLQVLADWIFGLAQGNPRAVMELAQYLVDRRIARYEHGSFVLPASLREQTLPRSIEQALDETIAALSPHARALGEALALVSEHGSLELHELVQLEELASPSLCNVALDELVAAQVVVVAGASCALRHRGFARALEAGSDPAQRSRRHLELAALYERRLASDPAQSSWHLIAAHHRFLGGDAGGCLEALLALPSPEGAFARSREVAEMYDACLSYAQARGLSPARVYPLRRALLWLSTSEPSVLARADDTLAQLARDSGRIYYAELAAESDPHARARACIRRARAVYDQTPEARRGLDPVHATQELGASVSTLIESYVAANDAEALARLPELIAPFTLLSPVLELISDLAQQSLDGVLRRQVTAEFRRTLARLELPVDGLDRRDQHRTRCVVSYWVGMDEAVLGAASALERAAVLERQTSFGALAAQVRCVYQLFQGNEDQAEIWQRRRELVLLRAPAPEVTSTRGILYEAVGYFLCGSVLGMRRTVRTIELVAARYPRWRGDLRAAEGLYALLRGEPALALSLLDADLAAFGRTHALLALGRFADADQFARAALEHHERAALHPLLAYPMRAAAALARSSAGEPAEAAHGLDLALARAAREGVHGMLLGVLHEARAKIAIAMGEEAAFRRHLHELGAAYGRGSSVLRARSEQLGLAARRALLSLPPGGALAEAAAADAGSEVRSILDSAFSRTERLSRALAMLAEHAKSSHAFLFGMQAVGLRLLASLGDGPPPDGIDDMLAVYLSAELEANEAAVAHSVTGSFAATPDMIAWINDGQYAYYPVLLSALIGVQRRIAGVAAIALPTQRDPKLPPDLVAEISRALLEAGDVIGANAAD